MSRLQGYISASNPANNPNTGPAIVSATLGNGFVGVEPVVFGNANAIDIPTGATAPLNLQDPDSMTVDPLGNIVLDSQADHELIIVSHPDQEDQRVLRLPLIYVPPTGAVPLQAADTAFVTSSEGFILFADKGLNTVFKLTAPAFAGLRLYLREQRALRRDPRSDQRDDHAGRNRTGEPRRLSLRQCLGRPRRRGGPKRRQSLRALTRP